MIYLDVGRIHHLHPKHSTLIQNSKYSLKYHTERCAIGARGKRSAELGAHSPRITMNTGDLTPNGAGLLSTLIGLGGTVDVGNTLAQIPVGLLLTVHILQLDDGGGGILGTLAALIAHVASLDVQTREGISWEGMDG